MSKPYFPYTGGKNGAGVYQQIINLIPPHNYYYEGFAGSAAIFRLKKPADFSFLFDIDKNVCENWGRCLENTPGVNVLNLSVTELLIKAKDFATDTFIYLDPPYLKSTRSCKKDYYKHEFTVFDHQIFLTQLLSLKCFVMVSHYKCAMYDEILNGWHQHHFSAQSRKGKRTETVYMNYIPPQVLHDYRYIGNNYREREQLKRQQKNFIKKLNSLPHHLRNSIIEQINSVK